MPFGRRRSRTTTLVAILLLTAGLAGVLAWQAADAAQSHRATAEGAMRDYANFAAYEFTSYSKDVLYSNVLFAFGGLESLEPRAYGPLPDPSVLANEKNRKLLCNCDSSRYYFRYDLRDNSYKTSGETPSTAMRAWIRDTLPRHVRSEYKDDWGYAVLFRTVANKTRGVVYQLKRDSESEPIVAYGFELCLNDFAPPAYRRVMEHWTVLPPSLTRGAPNDSLFSVRIYDADDNLVYASPVQYKSPFVGKYQLASFGGITTKVILRPELADALLIGGLPKSRVPLLLSVFALTLVLAGVGVQQLRREGELARLRSDFIASVSHELRTPLAQVRMFAETLLLGRVRSEAERTRSLQIIDQEARRLGHLVENILQFSRAERRAIKLARVPTDVGAEIREAIEAFSPVARARRVEVCDFCEDDVTGVVDPGALRQVVLNLLDNAVKYGPVGQTVTVRLSRAGDLACLAVEDQGPGIDPGDRDRVWLPFQRLDAAVSTAVAGSGIGLAIVAELVTLHGGRARVEDAPGRGARFVIEIPLTSPTGAHDAHHDPKGVGSRLAGVGSRVPLETSMALATPDSRDPRPATDSSALRDA